MHFNPQLFKVSIIQTKLFGPWTELSRFHCILLGTGKALIRLDVQADLVLGCRHMPKDKFLHDTAKYRVDIWAQLFKANDIIS